MVAEWWWGIVMNDDGGDGWMVLMEDGDEW